MRRRGLGVATLALAAILFATSGAGATPTRFSLVFDGVHTADRSFPAGLRHEGRFTASAPFCSAGTAVDVRDVVLEPLTVLRRHTCDDGSGTFTALLPGAIAEHGGTGTWKIVEGSGRYATLRGVGTYTGERLSGDPNDFLSIKYRTTWQGVVDFDAVAPSLALTARAKKLVRPARTYSLRLDLSLTDNVAGAAISYSVALHAAGRFVGSRAGTTSSGHATVGLRIRPPRRARRVQVVVTATDAVGNAGTLTRSLRLR